MRHPTHANSFLEKKCRRLATAETRAAYSESLVRKAESRYGHLLFLGSVRGLLAHRLADGLRFRLPAARAKFQLEGSRRLQRARVQESQPYRLCRLAFPSAAKCHRCPAQRRSAWS